ncbi:MAG: hypothetical protein J6U45_07665, partial [Alistipes sp.]|nr:hypothetical protein [Alistipes sp.]
MKTKSLISFCLLCSSILLFSCGGSAPVEPDLPEIPELPTPEINADTVEVSVKSAIHIDSEPLSTRSSINDLYAIQVWQKVPTTNEVGFSWTECFTYAHGYFDDLSKAVIKLAKRYKYGITIANMPVTNSKGVTETLNPADALELFMYYGTKSSNANKFTAEDYF